MLHVTEINEINELLELRKEWNDVLERSRDKHIYLTWEWQSTYWKHFGKEKRLRILCIKDRDKIIAIAPLRQSHYGFASPLGYEVIEPLGYRGLMPEGADYTGLILAEKEAKCLQLFLNYLAERNDWDFIYLYDVPRTSIIPNLLARASKTIPLTFELEKGVTCPYISVPNSIDILLKELSSKFRKNLRRCMRNLEKDYHRVELKTYDEFSSVEEAMRIFFDLHQKRWKLEHMPGVFNTQVRDFYIDVARLFADNGWLALYFLTANDEPIAAQYCFEFEQRMYYALSGFNPDYSRYSVGNLILMKVIEKCIERKIEEYDLLKGDEQYKFDWTAKYRRNLGIRFVNNKFTSNLLNWGIKTVKQTKMDKLLEKFLNF
jgi:CelD/BcsL family acetyltransferase involved in cellulose biosynthesis